MPRYVLDLGALPDWEPLERLLTVVGRHPSWPHVGANEFMFMGRLVAPRRPPILMYKHAGSRRYLYIDGAGHAFRVMWRGKSLPSGMAVGCAPLASPVAAIEAVAPSPLCPRDRPVRM